VKTRAITILAVVAILAVTACTPASAAPGSTGTDTGLVDAVAALKIEPEHSRDGYTRDAFKHWIDEDGDGCNTRSEVLIEESTVPAETDWNCRPILGEWYSYYDDRHFTAAGGLDIDHMVPLAEAWDSGADTWTPEGREYYANDLGEWRSLVAVSASANRSKGDRDPGEWVPAFEPARCRYISEWVTVKLRFGLSADPFEHGYLTGMAARCAAV
jgi:hypothetical protein